MNSIQIAICINDGYVPYACVTIKSIIENHKNKEVAIHLLSDFISDKMRKRLNEVVEGLKTTTLHIHIVNDESLRGLKDTWSIYTWYRVLLPHVLSNDIHRVLYLDADTVVAGDLSELFTIDMDKKAIAGSIDPESYNQETFVRCGYDSSKKYICAGVMLMNLDYWREHNLTDAVINWGRKNNDRIKFPDQDTINYLCRDTKIILPLQYGIIGGFFQKEQYYQKPFINELRNAIKSPRIIHYAGQAPWKKEIANHLMQKEWIKYNKMLQHPAKRYYITKGWLLVKMMLWKALHPFKKPVQLSVNDVKQKLNSL